MSRSKKNVDGKPVLWTQSVAEYVRDKAVSGETFSIEQALVDLRVPSTDRKYVRTLFRELYRRNTDYGMASGVRVLKTTRMMGHNLSRQEPLKAEAVFRRAAAKSAGPIIFRDQAELAEYVQRVLAKA